MTELVSSRAVETNVPTQIPANTLTDGILIPRNIQKNGTILILTRTTIDHLLKTIKTEMTEDRQ